MIEYTAHVYKDLIALYPAWADLKTYLTSVEGGSLVISDSNDQFCIIRSKTSVTENGPSHMKWFRSTVWNIVENRPVSFAPTKANSHLCYTSCQELVNAGIFCQEFLDGFMINCFKYAGNDELYITTRSKLGGTGRFYSNKSFRELFLEAYAGNVNDLRGPDVTKGEYAVSYSFLAQHIEHHVVTPITQNKAVLIQKAIFCEDGSMCVEDGFETFQDSPNIPVIPVEFEADETVDAWVSRFLSDKPWSYQGIVLKDAFGNRWRYRNELYMQVKALRGNSATHIERFAQLYRQNLIETYLQYYPLESYTFVCNNLFMNMIHQTVYNYYVQLHITKTITMNEIELQYRRHVYSLHKYYIGTLRPLKKKITYNEVARYFFNLPWQVLAHLLRISQDSYFSLMNEVVSQ